MESPSLDSAVRSCGDNKWSTRALRFTPPCNLSHASKRLDSIHRLPGHNSNRLLLVALPSTHPHTPLQACPLGTSRWETKQSRSGYTSTTCSPLPSYQPRGLPQILNPGNQTSMVCKLQISRNTLCHVPPSK
jgi:hypothetical protein